MIDRHGLDLANFALNVTNFATYIDSANDGRRSLSVLPDSQLILAKYAAA